MNTTKSIIVKSPLRLMYYVHTKTVSVGTALQCLDNEYLIGGKDNMIKVDVSVYCRILRRPEKLERNIN